MAAIVGFARQAIVGFARQADATLSRASHFGAVSRASFAVAGNREALIATRRHPPKFVMKSS
jgi:hypothetical protein